MSVALLCGAQDKWLKDTVENCRAQRYVTTIGGRRRYLNDIVSGDSKKRAAAERQAVHSAVQVFCPVLSG